MLLCVVLLTELAELSIRYSTHDAADAHANVSGETEMVTMVNVTPSRLQAI